jgi:hypothetical protein
MQHGVTAESAFRKWLSSLLPAQFAVTSGYVIPPLVTRNRYRLLHYDVIIYDRMAAPVLWVDGDDDAAEQGKRRAIPADHVRAIYEVKASFNKRSATEAVSKLESLGELKSSLAQPFHSGIVFFELARAMTQKTELLRILIGGPELVGYSGGMILRCEQNADMTGLFRPLPVSSMKEKKSECFVPLAKDIESLSIYRDPGGRPVIAEQGAGLVCFSDGENWHYRKMYGPIVGNKFGGAHLAWSYGGFATFAVDLLTYLQGKSPDAEGPLFAQVFDRIDPPET